MVSASLGEKNGVTSVILLPRKTVISLAAMPSREYVPGTRSPV